MWLHQQHASCDKVFQALPLLFVLQATEAGRGGLGMRQLITLYVTCSKKSVAVACITYTIILLKCI